MRPNFTCGALLLVALSSFGTTTASADTVYDDFKTKWRPIEFGIGASSEMVRNRLEITLDEAAGSGGDDFFASGLFSTCALKGDFDIRASYRLLVWPSQNGTRVALFLGSLAELGSDAGIYVERDSFSPADAAPAPEEYIFFGDNGQTYSEQETDHTAGTLRLRRIGPTVTGYYRSGSTWIELGTSVVGTQSLRFGVVAYSHDTVFASHDVIVAFESVRVTSGTFAGNTCPLLTS